ncbi:MAG: phage tail protein [Candidatus Hydrogenedentes bacterium]|nr:phage tail protein [Candidatus Hydrogenedentota bacterium]
MSLRSLSWVMRHALTLLVLSMGAAVAQAADFRVYIDGIGDPAEGLTEVVDITVEDLTIDVRGVMVPPPDIPSDPVEVMESGFRVYAPGDAHYGSITIRARVGTSSRELSEWVNDTRLGKNIRKSISIICLKRDGSEARRFNFLECFPVRWMAPEALGTRDYSELPTLVCSMEGVELPPPAEDKEPAPAGALMSVENDDGTVGLDEGWSEWRGGESGDLRERELQASQYHTTTPGHKYVDTLTLRGPLTAGRKALCQWMNNAVQGKAWKRTLTITEITRNGSQRTFTYLDCFPTRYVFPVFSADGTGNLYEEVSIKPIRLELK